MPTKRRRRRQEFRPQLTETVRRLLEIGRRAALDEYEEGDEEIVNVYLVPPDMLERLWSEHGAGLLSGWIAEHPGTRPWAWWRWDAREPRRVVRGTELLQAGMDDWWWKDRLGLPPLAQCRPAGFVGLPTVEAQAAYLRRLDLFVGDEARRVSRGAYAQEEVDFLLHEGELEELQAEGEHRRAEEREQRTRERAAVALAGNGHASALRQAERENRRTDP